MRRTTLRELIKDPRWNGNVSAFARDAQKPASQIQDMLDGRKAFGEKVARQIEQRIGLPLGTLDGAPPVSPIVRESAVVYGSPITAEASLVGREWDKLSEPIRTHIRQMIHMLVGTQVRARRAKKKDRPSRALHA